jgi:hypothetical protein
VKKKETPFWQQPVKNCVFHAASLQHAFHAEILMSFQMVTTDKAGGAADSNKYLEKIIFRSILGHEKLRGV